MLFIHATKPTAFKAFLAWQNSIENAKQIVRLKHGWSRLISTVFGPRLKSSEAVEMRLKSFQPHFNRINRGFQPWGFLWRSLAFYTQEFIIKRLSRWHWLCVALHFFPGHYSPSFFAQPDLIISSLCPQDPTGNVYCPASEAQGFPASWVGK